jgi:hypothetical protein
LILAHGIGGRSDLPIPLPILILAAGGVLVVTFIALGVMWKSPRFQEGPHYERPGAVIPTRGLLAVVGVVSLLLVIAQVVVPLVGADREPIRPTIAPVMVWVVFWLVVPFAGGLIGDWYTDLNPWRAIARTARLGRGERTGLLDTAGLWPASGLFVAFAWFELVYPNSGDPTLLGVAALAYTTLLVLAMALVGRETGLAVFDFFTPYNRVISAISPLGRDREGRLVWRGWLRSLPVIPSWPGLWFFAAVMIGTVTYDGVEGSDWFRAITGGLGESLAGSTFLLVATVNVIALVYYLACAVAARLDPRGRPTREVAQRFAHTLVPIGLAYAVSHYLTLILFEGQQIVAALSDPFGLGWDLFGTAGYRVEFFIRSSTPIWLAQVAFIVGGHLVGVVLAHDRSLQDFGRDAARSQYAMLVLMIALTSLGLLILSG